MVTSFKKKEARSSYQPMRTLQKILLNLAIGLPGAAAPTSGFDKLGKLDFLLETTCNEKNERFFDSSTFMHSACVEATCDVLSTAGTLVAATSTTASWFLGAVLECSILATVDDPVDHDFIYFVTEYWQPEFDLDLGMSEEDKADT